MSRLRARIAKLDGDQAVHRWEVWYQDTQGADAFTCEHHPGEVLTNVDIRARVDPPGVGRIVVYRVDMAPGEVKAPEGDA